eukprot:scaffold20009_cov74-Cylindrotheca_fusiformis.AAC.1
MAVVDYLSAKQIFTTRSWNRSSSTRQIETGGAYLLEAGDIFVLSSSMADVENTDSTLLQENGSNRAVFLHFFAKVTNRDETDCPKL